MNKTESLRANVDVNEKQEIERISELIDMPVAQIVREGTREKVAKLKKTHPKLKGELLEVPA